MKTSRRPIMFPALGALCLAGAAHAAPEFSVDVEAADGDRSRIFLSYLAEGNVTALDFTVQLDVTGDFSADVSQCMASLPKSHTGACRVRGDTLRGVVYSTENHMLGDTNIGRVMLMPGSLLKAAGTPTELKVRGVNVTAVSPNGNSVTTAVRVNGQTVPDK